MPATDRSAEIGELPETNQGEKTTFWFQFVPTALCMTLPLIPITAGWLPRLLRDTCATFSSQSSMLRLVYTGNAAAAHLPVWSGAFGASAMRGALAVLLALLLACTSVFRTKFRRRFRLGAFLESGIKPLRAMQSGHPGDYVLWLTIGVASVGAASMLLLR